jgi:hypothetical protein
VSGCNATSKARQEKAAPILMSIFFTYNTCFLDASNNHGDRLRYNGCIYDDRDKHANHDYSKSDDCSRHSANNDGGVDDASDDDNERTQQEQKKARR